MGHIADTVRRFFHPTAINDMLAAFVPGINGTDLNVGYLYSGCDSRYLTFFRAFLRPNITF